jgi:hypothetical protein
MKQSTFRKNLVWLRICITTFLLAIVCLFLFSFTVSSRLTEDIWNQLGLTRLQGTEKIRNSFVNNYLDYYGLRKAKNIAVGSRGAVAKDLLIYTKQYLSSAAFKTDYEKMRNAAKPMEPVPGSKTKELIRKWKIEETTKLMKNTEDFLKTADAEMKKTMQKVLDMHKANMKDYQDPNSKLINALWQQELDIRENDQKRYKESIKTWEMNYPVDYRKVIRPRLEKYLELAATVDFSAEIFQKADKKYYFRSSAYEAKHDDWKLIYRAGKEVYDVTKVFVEQWLKEFGE